MARIENVVDFIESTKEYIDVDMTLVELGFGNRPKLTTAKQIEYDVATVEGKTAKFTSFSETANVVEKDGKATITLDPFTVNDKTPFTELDAAAEKFGGTKYDTEDGYTYDTDAEEVAKLHLGALLRRKKLAASVYAYGNLTTERDGIDADYNIPSQNFTVLSSGLWNASGATPIADIKAQIEKMKVKPTFIVMGADTWSNMVKNGEDVILNDNATGRSEPRNLILNPDATNEGTTRIGKIVEAGAMVDVYVSFDVDESGVAIFPDGYVGFGVKNGGHYQFTGVPFRDAPDGQVRYHAVEWYPVELRASDPDVDAINYRSGFLPVAQRNEAWGSIKAY